MLEHHCNAISARRARFGRRKGLTAQQHLAAVGFDQPVDHLDQRGFARAVFAQQRVHLAHANVEGNRVVGHHTRIGLGQPLNAQQNVAHARISLSCWSSTDALERSRMATPIAMACGCLPNSGAPIGQVMCAIVSGAWPNAASRDRKRAHLLADPINPAKRNPWDSSRWHSSRSSAWE